MSKKPTLGQVLVMAGGALTFIFGFLAWFSTKGGFGFGGKDISAWSGDAVPGLFPWATTVPVLCLVVAILTAVKTFGGSFPEKLWIFTLDQINLVVGAGSLWLVVALLIADKHGADTGIGLILSIFTTAAVLVGAIFDVQGIATDVFSRPATAGGPGGYPPQQWQQPGAPGQPPGGWGQPPQAPPPQQPPPPAPSGQAPPPPPPGGQTF